jgi:hypothetical protein
MNKKIIDILIKSIQLARRGYVGAASQMGKTGSFDPRRWLFEAIQAKLAPKPNNIKSITKALSNAENTPEILLNMAKNWKK